jgi:PEP-CTERM motif-containing protein
MRQRNLCLLVALLAVGLAPVSSDAAIDRYSGAFQLDVIDSLGGVIASINIPIPVSPSPGGVAPLGPVGPFGTATSMGTAMGKGFFGIGGLGSSPFMVTKFHANIAGGPGFFAASANPPPPPCTLPGAGVCLVPGFHHFGGALPVNGVITLSGTAMTPGPNMTVAGPLFTLMLAPPAGGGAQPNATFWTTGIGVAFLAGQGGTTMAPKGAPAGTMATFMSAFFGSGPSGLGGPSSALGSTTLTLVTPYRFIPVIVGPAAFSSYDDLIGRLSLTLHLVPVPEPATAALLGLGLVCTGLVSRRRR